MKNQLFGILIFIILFIITLFKFNYFVFCLLILIMLYLVLKKEYKLFAVYILFSSFILIGNYLDNNNYTANFNKTFKVVEVNENYCLIKQDNHKYLIYQDDYVLKEGNLIKLKGKQVEISQNGVPYLFSFKDYLENKKVYYQVDYTDLEITNDKTSLRITIIDKLLSRIKYSNSYLNLLLFNNKSDEIIDLYDGLVRISAIQLFVISGFHINLIYNVINKVLKRFTKKDDNIFIFILLFIYEYLLNFSLSSLRAYLSLLFNKLNKRHKLGFNNLNINSLIGILFLIIRPKTLFMTSFQLSISIILALNIISNINNKEKKGLVFIIPFLISLPIIINMNNNIGLLNIFMNFLFTPLVSVIFILGVGVIILPILDIILYFIILGFEEIVTIISIKNIYFPFPNLSITYLIVYFVIIYLIILSIYLKRKRFRTLNIILLSTFLITWCIKPFSNPYILFFDVGQGDSCLIHGQDNKYNILIDTGGSLYSDIAKKKLIPYFQKDGIKKLDLVIISHLDYDHYGALESLKSNFKILKIIQDNNYENIYFKDLKFKNLNNFYSFNEEDENVKSSVLLFDFIGLKFLLTGDAPLSIEKKIIETYSIDVDVLKVGHHGSNTSTSKEFIQSIKPEVSIISVGKNNQYKHPHKEVVDNLCSEGVAIFRTDINGSIKISRNIFKEIIINTKL